MLFFFFKQKTAYEMRISDWSSDVCSSDLGALAPGGQVDLFMQLPFGQFPTLILVQRGRAQYQPADLATHGQDRCQVPAIADPDHRDRVGIHVALAHEPIVGRTQVREVLLPVRSEEHTSELQSLMRISYAVFCLK